MTIEETLKDRGKKYGDFANFANISRQLQAVIEKTQRWKWLQCYQQEALTMITHKIARILNGDSYHVDSWHDIAGYATLVENILKTTGDSSLWKGLKAGKDEQEQGKD